MFSPHRFSSKIVVVDPTEPDLQQGWDTVLRDLATEPDLDAMPASVRRLPAFERAPARGFGGLLDLMLVGAAVVTAVVVSALAMAVFFG